MVTRSTTQPTASDADGSQDLGVDAIAVADRQRAQRILLVFARLGAITSEAIRARVDPGLTSNVEVLVLTSLDLLGPQRPADILALTGMTSGGVTKVLDRLEARGLLTREFGQVTGDRRGTRLVITAAGMQVASELAAALDSRMDAVREAIEALRLVAGD